MIIRIDEESEAKLMEWARRTPAAKVDAEVLGAGYTLHIAVAPPFGCFAKATWGHDVLEIGEVEVTFGVNHSRG